MVAPMQWSEEQLPATPEHSSPARSEDELRAALARAMRTARDHTDAVFAHVAPDGYYARPIAERHRLIFYLGHLEVFDWNLLVRDCLRRPSRNPDWEKLFAFGIDPVDGDVPDDGPEDWPSIGDVRGYGEELRADVDAHLASAPLRGWLENGWAWRIAIEHRAMHAETLAYLLHGLAHGHKRDGTVPRDFSSPPPAREMVAIAAGDAQLGRSFAESPHDGWDNEYEAHTVRVPAFRIEKYAVTNLQWLEFVDAGGYRRAEWWTDEAWRWRQQVGIERPHFWTGERGERRLRTMFGAIPLPLAWPVYVSHAEASAFARWRGRQLPTEAQWHRAALGTPDGAQRERPWGAESPRPGHHGNFGFASWDPVAVDSHPAGQSAFGVFGMQGNGWQWTRTPFAPFEGFRALPFYRGYSADFFDGVHFVLKGASPVTETVFLRRSFRNWFQSHYPHMFATLRLVDENV
jgi:ergothioneine biosynthesis protein EgtB